MSTTTTTSEVLEEKLEQQATAALKAARQYCEATVRTDGHWCGELKSNATITAEYVFLLQSLGLHHTLDVHGLGDYFQSDQNSDGSWSLAPGEPGDISTTTEAYLALKILGHSPKSPVLSAAQKWVTSTGGGVERVRIFTRIYLATFGLFPWSYVPQLPAELILMPTYAPINIYKFSSWARSTIVPLLVICHHKPVFALPNGRSATNDFLDELWMDPTNKNVPSHKGIFELVSGTEWLALTFVAIDKTLGCFGGLREYNPIRKLALSLCMNWIMKHQEPSGDWAGIFPPMHLGILACYLQGYTIEDSPIRRGLAAVERFAWKDTRGKRMQSCVSPVWDTILMSIALSDSKRGSEKDIGKGKDFMHQRGIYWVRARQLLGGEGDWRVYRNKVTTGGFSFEYYNAWYPDVDDTAAAIVAFLKHDRSSITSPHVLDAVKWVLGMQNKDGGWAAFDADNDRLFLNKIPFSDMDSFCDPSTADVVGRVLEAFGLFLLCASETSQQGNPLLYGLLENMQQARWRGIRYLATEQEANGSWYGRWGVNYIYGTSNALAGLSYFGFNDDEGDDGMEQFAKADPSPASLVPNMILSALRFLIDIQNEDGGWGEALSTYRVAPEVKPINVAQFKMMHSAPSTASQTAWALLGLMPYLPKDHPVVESGVRYLIETQNFSDLTSAITPDPSSCEHFNDTIPLWTGCSEMKAGLSSSRSTSNIQHPTGLTWASDRYTGTGFPNHFYIGYQLYSHYFPMMALGRYLTMKKQDQLGEMSLFP